MTQRLFLLLTALFCTIGVWAADVKVGISTGTFYRDGVTKLTPSSSNQYASKWVSSHESGLTMTCSKNNMIINTGYGTSTCLNLHTDPQNYTLTVAGGYKITGYSITAYAGNGTSSINGKTVGTTAAHATTVTSAELSTTSTTFVIAGTANPWMYIVDFTVSVEFKGGETVELKLVVNVAGTTEAENTRVGKVIMNGGGLDESKFLYADTSPMTFSNVFADALVVKATIYRGYEFTGFSIGDVDYGTSIEADELAGIATGSTIVANYMASTGNGINLWYDYNDDMSDAYRIPALVRTQSGRLIAFSDYRPGLKDVGGGACSIERRYSDDNGETWSPALRVAEGNWGVNKKNVIEWSFGDAAVVADNTPGNSGDDVLMICCGGNSLWSSSVYNPDVSKTQQGCVRWRSTDGGVTWGDYEYIMPGIMQAFVDAGLRSADGSSGIVRAFFTSGKITQSVRKAEGAQYNRLYCAVDVPDNDVVMYSDDFGETWTVLGGQVANNGDEAHIVELPDGDLLLVGRGNSSRWVNVFNYADFSAATGQWGAKGQWNNAVATSCNGDVEVIEACDVYGKEHTVVIETAPMYSNQRRDIQYYFIALPKATGFSVSDFSTVGGASWTQGMNVTHNWSAYSALVNNGDGTFDILFEECAKDETKAPSGYCIVYQPAHNIKDITRGQFIFDKTVDIEQIDNRQRTADNGAVYNLSGQLVNDKWINGKLPRGISVTKSKKILH